MAKDGSGCTTVKIFKVSPILLDAIRFYPKNKGPSSLNKSDGSYLLMVLRCFSQDLPVPSSHIEFTVVRYQH